jgi:hypothetical protein
MDAEKQTGDGDKKAGTRSNGLHDADKLSIELVARREEKGNFGLGSGTHQDAERLGREWVGENARLASDGRTLVSADELRQYRPPEFKSRLGREQANFERRTLDANNKWVIISNGHLDITP